MGSRVPEAFRREPGTDLSARPVLAGPSPSRVAPPVAAPDPYLVGVPRSGRSSASNVGVSLLLAAAVVVPCVLLAVGPAPAATALAAAAPSDAGPLTTVTAPTAPACTPAPLEQRAAAVIMVGLPGITSADDPLARAVVDLGVSGVFLSASNVRSTAQVRALAAGLRAQA